MEIIDFYIFALPVTTLELLTVIAGVYYLKKTKSEDKLSKYLIWFFLFTFLVEVIGAYSPIAYFSNYEYFSFVKDTIFVRNKWLYNIYAIISFSFFPLYFGYYLSSWFWKLILKILVPIYILASITSFFIYKDFFTSDSKFVNLTGALLLFLSVVLFYFELLKSNLILNLKRFLPMYISIGVFIFYLCVTPLTFFSSYFNSENDTFVKLQVHLILYSNIFMYSCFILGFILCSRKKRSY